MQFSFSRVLANEKMLDFLTSGTAITAYVLIILAVIAALIITLMVKEVRAGNETEYKIVGDVSLEDSPKTHSAPEKEERGERFYMLCEIDKKKDMFGHAKYDKGISLESFCEDFRNFAASKLKLYYDIKDIRRFVAGMAVSKIVILQGMSGTGKTSLAHAFGAFTDNPSTVIPVQPMWKERTDLIGYYNEFTRRFNETLLLTKMYEANYSKDVYVTVLDEMNIARVEYYFAEMLLNFHNVFEHNLY